MLPQFDAFGELFRFVATVGVLSGAMAWWRKDSPEEDKIVSGAANELLNGLSDADLVNKIQGETELNLRDQVSIEQAEDWARDRDLRGFIRRN